MCINVISPIFSPFIPLSHHIFPLPTLLPPNIYPCPSFLLPNSIIPPSPPSQQSCTLCPSTIFRRFLTNPPLYPPHAFLPTPSLRYPSHFQPSLIPPSLIPPLLSHPITSSPPSSTFRSSHPLSSRPSSPNLRLITLLPTALSTLFSLIIPHPILTPHIPIFKFG
jgi:hypothetical protein